MQYMNRARETGGSAVARFTGSTVFFLSLSWGLRPRLYSAPCFAGSGHNMLSALFPKAKKGFSELLARRSAAHAIVILYRKLSAVGRHEPLFFVSSC